MVVDHHQEHARYVRYRIVADERCGRVLFNSHTTMASSRQWNGPFQYVDVDSIAAISTPFSTSQARINRNEASIVLNVRV